MTNAVKYGCIAGLMALAISTKAQDLEMGYFNKGFVGKEVLNPAFAGEYRTVSIPVLGGFHMSLRGNMGVKDYIYNRNGKTVTFMNGAVGANDFLNRVNARNRTNLDTYLQLLRTSFFAWGGYNTISLNAREHMGVVIPGELFKLAKEGPKNQRYDIGSLKGHADAYMELAMGHSRQLTDQWRIGATFKVLVGLMNVDASFRKAQLDLSEDGYSAQVDAELSTSIKGVYYESETKMRGPEMDRPHTYVNGMDADNPGPNGFGLALDLGASYRLNPDWEFSASLSDIGFLRWANNRVASTDGIRTVKTDSYLFNVDEDASNNFDDELDYLSEELATLYELQDLGDQGAKAKALGAVLRLGAEYTFPYYRNLSFGALSTTRIMGAYSWTDLRLTANVAPVKFFSASLGIAEGSYGFSWGWLLNFHPKGVNFFLGMDQSLSSLSKEGVPLTSQVDLSMGFNVTF